MSDGKVEKASHVVYQCSYHLVWTPRYRYRILQGKIKDYYRKEEPYNMRHEENRNTRTYDKAQPYPHGSDNPPKLVPQALFQIIAVAPFRRLFRLQDEQGASVVSIHPHLAV